MDGKLKKRVTIFLKDETAKDLNKQAKSLEISRSSMASIILSKHFNNE